MLLWSTPERNLVCRLELLLDGAYGSGLRANGHIVRVRLMVIERSRRDFLKQASMLARGAEENLVVADNCFGKIRGIDGASMH